MNIVFLTGIWPPDVGGPATHGPDFAAFLRDRGHTVRVVTMGDSEPTERPVPVEWVTRRQPFPVRYSRVALQGFRRARAADVVYATATYAAAAAASLGKPLVAKLVSDPAFERAYRYGLYRGPSDAFEEAPGARLALLRRLRDTALGRAQRIVVPSRYLAEQAIGWGLERSRVEVLVNPAPPPLDVAAHALGARTLVFAGRLTPPKALPVLLDALAQVEDAELLVVGDGEERGSLERRVSDLGLEGRVRFLGAQPRGEVLRYLAGARAAVLSSAWENLPHAAVEALAVGTPVIATAVGGVPEVVHDHENGLLVAPNDPAALAAALRRVLDDQPLRARLAAGTQPSVAAIGRDAIYARLEQILAEAAR